MQQQVNVDVSSLQSVLCECGCEYWKQVVLVKIVSAIMSPTGKETLVNIPTLLCVECGMEINKLIDKESKHANLSI